MCKQMDTTAMYPLKAHIIDCTVANSMETKPQPYTVKPVCNDHLYNKMYYLWFIQ